MLSVRDVFNRAAHGYSQFQSFIFELDERTARQMNERHSRPIVFDRNQRAFEADDQFAVAETSGVLMDSLRFDLTGTLGTAPWPSISSQMALPTQHTFRLVEQKWLDHAPLEVGQDISAYADPEQKTKLEGIPFMDSRLNSGGI